MNSIIKVNNFSKQYRNMLVKINDIDFTKRVSLLVGNNGSGKTTLLKGIANFIKYKGEIISDKKICFMSEKANYPLDLELTTFLEHLNNISSNPISIERINKLLVSFNLLDKQKELLHNLSKGMKAKVNIVQCLMEDSDIYLLDEPLSGLDKEGIRNLVNHIKKSRNCFIISTHLASDFSDISDEVFYL